MTSFARTVFDLKARTVLRSSDQSFRALVRDERLEPDALQALVDRRAAQTARFAMDSTTFYRERYRDAGFTPEDLRDPAAFRELPIVEKSDVRERFDDFVTPQATARTSARSKTGGSTGEPLSILRDLRVPHRALEWRLFRWWGVHPSDDVAIVRRDVRTAGESRLHRLQWWPSRRLQLDAYHMQDDHIESFLHTWEEVRPRVVIGYVGAIVQLARYVEAHGLSPEPPRVIATTAAPLAAAQRAEVERILRAPVRDHYRSAEVPWMAGECGVADGLHVFADVRRLELVGPDGAPVAPASTGQVVATDYTNRVFPLVRYRLGDFSRELPEQCPCGVTLPRIASIAGRVTDDLRLPSGQVAAGEALTQTFEASPDSVRQFQIAQAADYSITVRCILGTRPDAPAQAEAAITRLRGILGGEVPVSLEVVDSIPHEGGKVRYITSAVR